MDLHAHQLADWLKHIGINIAMGFMARSLLAMLGAETLIICTNSQVGSSRDRHLSCCAWLLNCKLNDGIKTWRAGQRSSHATPHVEVYLEG